MPGIFMGIATLIFWIGRRQYVIKPNRQMAGQGGANSWTVLGHIVLIFLPIPIFWALFNQVNTTWVLQGVKMLPFHIGGFKVDAERMQSVGPFLVLLWVPVLTIGVYPLMERLGLRPTPLRRMGFGMVLAILAFVVSAVIQLSIDKGQTPSIAWQIIPYTILEAGEVMVSATALEFAFSQAPASAKSTIMSLWLMTIAGGHFLVAAFTNLNARFVHAKGAPEFFFYAGLMLVATMVFAWIASRYPGRAAPPSQSAPAAG